MKLPAAPLPARLILLVPAAIFAGQADARLGPVGNVGLSNPNQIDPGGDGFGVATATGDFNGDGIDDLAVADRQHPNLVRIYYGTAWTIGNPVANPFLFETVPVPTVPGATLGPNTAPSLPAWPTSSIKASAA